MTSIQFNSHSHSQHSTQDDDPRFDIYALLLTINQLERAWIKGHFNSNPDLYHTSIQQLLSQYNSIQATITSGPLSSILDFANLKGLELGVKRVQLGLGPNNDSTSNNKGGDRKRIAEATSAFITLLDAIKLHLNTKVDLHPLLAEVVIKCQDALGEEAFKDKRILVPWLVKLNQLGDDGELNDLEMEGFLLDVESSYDGFIEGL